LYLLQTEYKAVDCCYVCMLVVGRWWSMAKRKTQSKTLAGWFINKLCCESIKHEQWISHCLLCWHHYCIML